MILPDVKQLALTSLRDPREAAQQILNLRFTLKELWGFVALTATSGAILQGVTQALVPLPEGLPVIFTSPIIFAVLLGGIVVLSAYALAWIGKAFGGQATVAELLALITWLQALNVLIQAVALVLMFVSVPLSNGLGFIAGLWGIWLTINFVDEAQGFGSLLKSVLVVILSSFGAATGFIFFILLFGALFTGTT